MQHNQIEIDDDEEDVIVSDLESVNINDDLDSQSDSEQEVDISWFHPRIKSRKDLHRRRRVIEEDYSDDESGSNESIKHNDGDKIFDHSIKEHGKSTNLIQINDEKYDTLRNIDSDVSFHYDTNGKNLIYTPPNKNIVLNNFSYDQNVKRTVRAEIMEDSLTNDVPSSKLGKNDEVNDMTSSRNTPMSSNDAKLGFLETKTVETLAVAENLITSFKNCKISSNFKNKIEIKVTHESEKEISEKSVKEANLILENNVRRNENKEIGLEQTFTPSSSLFDSDSDTKIYTKTKPYHLSPTVTQTTKIEAVPSRLNPSTMMDHSSLYSPKTGSLAGESFETNNDDAWVYDYDTREYYLSDLKQNSKSTARSEESDDTDKNFVADEKWPNLRLPKKLFEKLFDHQKSGVQWMAGLHRNGIGGILGDDMGMGKTFQTLTLLGGLMRQRTVRNSLIIAPVSLLRTWEKEAIKIFKKFECVPQVTIIVLGSNVAKLKRKRLLLEALECEAKYPHLVISTYGLVASSPLDLLPQDYRGRPTKWDYVILDEGHKIKNSATKVSKACRIICEGEMRSKRAENFYRTKRILLTGTPIQNNLREMWALFDWATSGKVLGKLQTFLNKFAIPIEDGRHKDAVQSTIRIANKANKQLQKTIQPYFLQRLKASTFADELPSKKDLVIWTHLSKKQRAMYEDYLVSGSTVQRVLNGEMKSPLQAITYLKKVCGHPSLIDQSYKIDSIGSDRLLKDSAKLQTLLALVESLNKSKSRILIFSQSTKILDILEKILQHLKLSRIDGKTKERDRQYLVDKFNGDNSKISVMLLSTKAAGLGLTLTGADRAIIYDPSWNPAEDAQAVDRCYRIGQSKAVTVYRLISAGTVEERMYEKQVFKDGLRRTILTNGGDATERYFDKNDLKRMFTLDPIGHCEMMQKLNIGVKVESNDKNMLSFMENHPSIIGFSSHDLVYTKEEINVDVEAGKTPFASTPIRNITVKSKLSSHEYHRVGMFSDNENEASSWYSRNSPIPLIKKRQKQKSHTRTQSKQINHIESKHSQNKENKENIEINVNECNVIQNLDKNTVSPFTMNKCITKVDALISSNDHLEQCMAILLDIIETDDIEKADKLRVHARIASTAGLLGWL